MPKVSVVMPVYNGELYLKEAIDSILNQTYKDFEFIIINDGSTDGTEDIIKSYTDSRIIYLKNDENLGIVGTLNKGLDAAKGEYIARMDADDISMPSRFERQVEFLDKNPNTIVCGHNISLFNEANTINKNTIYPENSSQIKTSLLFGCSIAHPTVMMRNDIIKRNKLRYNKEYEKVEDYHFWVVLSEYGDFYNIQENLLKYRIHANQITQLSTKEQLKGRYKIANILLKKHFDFTEDQLRIVVNAFNIKNISNDKFREFENLSMEMFKTNVIELNKAEINLILKSRIIELAISNKIMPKFFTTRIIGIKAYCFLALKKFLRRD